MSIITTILFATTTLSCILSASLYWIYRNLLKDSIDRELMISDMLDINDELIRLNLDHLYKEYIRNEKYELAHKVLRIKERYEKSKVQSNEKG